MLDPPLRADDLARDEQPRTEEAVTEEQRQWATRRIRAKRAFRVHLAVYLAVNALLVLIWAMTSASSFWPVWPMFGWGIGVAAHAASVYAGSSEISEAQIDRELQGRLGS